MADLLDPEALYRDHFYDPYEERDDDYRDDYRDDDRERDGCRDCGAEFDHEPDCMTAAALVQAQEEDETVSSHAVYGAAIRPLVDALLDAQGDGLRELQALGRLFTAHNKHGGLRG